MSKLAAVTTGQPTQGIGIVLKKQHFVMRAGKKGGCSIEDTEAILAALAKNHRLHNVRRQDDGSVMYEVYLDKQQYRDFVGDKQFFANQAWTLFPDEPLTSEEQEYVQ